MDHNGLEYYREQLAWKIMNKKDVLLDYIKENPNKRKYELVNELVHKTKDMQDYMGNIEKDKRIMSYATLNKHLLGLKRIGRIIQDKKTKTYSINSNYIEISESTESQLRLMFEKEWNKILDLQTLDINETELWFRIYDKNKIWYNFGELNDKIFFSHDIQTLIGRLILSLLRECIIMNPELWFVMTKPEHFKFSFGIECNLQEDPKIFELIKDIRQKYLERKEVNLYSISPFIRKLAFDYSDLHNIKLIESKTENLKFKIDRPLKDLYHNAVGQDTLLKKKQEKEEMESQKDFQKYIDKQVGDIYLENLPYYRKLRKQLGERKELEPYYKEKMEALDKAIKELEEKLKALDK